MCTWHANTLSLVGPPTASALIAPGSSRFSPGWIAMADPQYVPSKNLASGASYPSDSISSFYQCTRDCMPAGMHELKPNALPITIPKPDQKPYGSKSGPYYLLQLCIGLRTPSLNEGLVLKQSLEILDHQTPVSELMESRIRLVVLEVLNKSRAFFTAALGRSQPLELIEQVCTSLWSGRVLNSVIIHCRVSHEVSFILKNLGWR